MSVDIKHHLPEALKDIGTFVALGVRPAVNNNRKHTIVSTTNVAKCIVHFHLHSLSSLYRFSSHIGSAKSYSGYSAVRQEQGRVVEPRIRDWAHNETRGCRALWAENEKTPTREGEGWGKCASGGLSSPPAMGSCPCCPCVGGYVSASVRRAVQPLGEPPTPSGDGSRFRAPVAPQRADGAVPAPSQPDTIPSFFHLASLSYLSIGSVLTLVQSTLSTGVDKYSRASAHQRACVRACGGRSPVCMCYATLDGGGKETAQRKQNRKNGAIRILECRKQETPTTA